MDYRFTAILIILLIMMAIFLDPGYIPRNDQKNFQTTRGDSEASTIETTMPRLFHSLREIDETS